MDAAQDLFNQMKGAVPAGAHAFLQSFCQNYAKAQAAGQALPALPELPGMGGGMPGMGGCATPASRDPRNPAFPSLNFPNCPAKCDPCAFPAIELDLFLRSWPEIEAQMWDTFTQIDLLLSGAFPLAAGATAVLEQQARRTLTWIPDCIEISTTWSGGNPQPGFLSYQWGSASRGTAGPGITFSTPMKGQQFEPNPAQTVQVPFPTYKGCDNMVIGTLSTLRLTVVAASNMTSVLESITVTAYHKKRKAASCQGGSACSCH